MAVKRYSFDVFDTAVSRVFARPTDLFYAAGEILAGSAMTGRTRHSFASKVRSIRVQAERRALKTVWPREAPTLKDIYRQLRVPSILGFSASELEDIELELERRSVYPVEIVKRRIRDLREGGTRILFISDMYLPGSFIRDLLFQCDVMHAHDGLYVSADVGLSKRSGNLFRHVLSVENIAPNEMLHFGDDRRGDVVRPRSLGIQAKHFRGSALDRHETRTLINARMPYSQASRTAARSRRARLAVADPAADSSDSGLSFLTSVIAPFLVAFVAWVLERATKQDVKRLFFVARDGELLLKIARVLASSRESPELIYLYGSRKSWLLPSLAPRDPAWQRMLLDSDPKLSALSILRKLGFPHSDALPVLSRLGFLNTEVDSPLTRAAAVELLNRIIGDSLCLDALNDKAISARTLANQYFASLGMFDDKKWALVDVGWGLNCQAALKRIIAAKEQAGANVAGYYLALSKNHLPEWSAGRAEAMTDSVRSLFARRAVVIEHIFTPATHPSTVSYSIEKGGVTPKLAEETRSEGEIRYVAALHEAVVEYARLAAGDAGFWGDLERFRDIATSTAERFLSNPSATEAQGLVGYRANSDMGHDNRLSRALCGPLTFGDVLGYCHAAFGLGRSFESLPWWIEGSGALSRAPARALVRLMVDIDKYRHRLFSA